jgi:hypothetical protein
MLTGLFRRLSMQRQPHIIHGHSLTLEDQVFTLPGLAQVKCNVQALLDVGDEPLVRTITEIRYAHVIYKQVAKAMHKPYPGIRDERIQELQTSLGWSMAAFIGIIPNSPLATPDRIERHRAARNFYNDIMADRPPPSTPAEKETRTLSFARLRDDVIASCDVLLTTIDAAADPKYRLKKDTTDIKIVEEAARATENSVLAATANDLVLGTPVIQIGDHQQLPALQMASTKKGHQQISTSQQQRFAMTGLAFTKLSEEYRFTGGICGLVNLEYRGQLHAHPSTTGREINGTWTAFVDELFPLAGETKVDDFMVAADPIPVNRDVMLFNIQYTTRLDTVTKSYCNLQTLRFGVDLLVKLTEYGIPGHAIGLLTPYTGQLQLYQRCLTTLAENHVDLEDVRVMTIDSAHGQEFEIVILDLVNTTRLGFLNRERINTAQSRGRNACIFIADVAQLEQIKKFDKNLLGRSFQYIKQNQGMVHVSPTDLQSLITLPDMDVTSRHMEDQLDIELTQDDGNPDWDDHEQNEAVEMQDNEEHTDDGDDDEDENGEHDHEDDVEWSEEEMSRRDTTMDNMW